MTLKEFLLNNPLLSRSELAKKLWPHISGVDATKLMSAKRRESKNNNSKHYFSDKEVEDAIKFMEELSKNIEEFKKHNTTK